MANEEVFSLAQKEKCKVLLKKFPFDCDKVRSEFDVDRATAVRLVSATREWQKNENDSDEQKENIAARQSNFNTEKASKKEGALLLENNKGDESDDDSSKTASEFNCEKASKKEGALLLENNKGDESEDDSSKTASESTKSGSDSLTKRERLRYLLNITKAKGRNGKQELKMKRENREKQRQATAKEAEKQRETNAKEAKKQREANAKEAQELKKIDDSERQDIEEHFREQCEMWDESHEEVKVLRMSTRCAWLVWLRR